MFALHNCRPLINGSLIMTMLVYKGRVLNSIIKTMQSKLGSVYVFSSCSDFTNGMVVVFELFVFARNSASVVFSPRIQRGLVAG